ncbi:hypothetical protein M513_08171 [Trichuris suis]|uniref:Uncharacterized protein n=1 Tax=Trichuris suis TaxID=68888 RepID=A0A085M192_9BILA|nr:hypothetical protein M513_08171 [Trichuris suis]
MASQADERTCSVLTLKVKSESVAVKIPKVEILIGQNPDSRNPERSKSRMGRNPDRSESRIGRKCSVKCGLASVVH